jgi:NADPH2:quinone reductase
MRAIEITQPGKPEVLQLCERPTPVLKSGEVLIKVHAAGINRPDVFQRLGQYPVPPGASDLPGLEVAGEIVDGDLDGSGFAKGDMVCALVQGGGYAEYCAAPLAQCLPVPAGWSKQPRCRKPSLPSGRTYSTGRSCRRARRCWCRAVPPASA